MEGINLFASLSMCSSMLRNNNTVEGISLYASHCPYTDNLLTAPLWVRPQQLSVMVVAIILQTAR